MIERPRIDIPPSLSSPLTPPTTTPRRSCAYHVVNIDPKPLWKVVIKTTFAATDTNEHLMVIVMCRKMLTPLVSQSLQQFRDRCQLAQPVPSGRSGGGLNNNHDSALIALTAVYGVWKMCSNSFTSKYRWRSLRHLQHQQGHLSGGVCMM